MSFVLSTEKRIKNIERVEKYIDIDENLLEFEKDNDLIRMDMNIVEYPIFSKAKERKKNQIVKYYFKSDKSSSIEVEPAEGYAIPGEFEERVFIALTKIMRDNNYGQTFFVLINDIYKALNYPKTSNIYSKIRKALKVMSNNFYRFENTLYSNEINSLIDKTVETNIMNIVEITRKDKESNHIETFEDGRVKSIYKISLTDHFYDNIIKKGYLVFDSSKLLEISNSTTRNIYTLLEKWRKYDLYIKRPAFFIARRIPLSWDKRSIDRTVKRIAKSLEELKKQNLIDSYNIIRNGKWEKSEVEVFYKLRHNSSKSKNFNMEKVFFNQELQISKTEIRSSLRDEIQDIISLFPPRARKYITLPKLIEEALKNYSYDYVQYTAEYTSIHCKRSYLSYFKGALENQWAKEYIEKKRKKENKMQGNKNQLLINIEEKKDEKSNNNLLDSFLILNKKTQERIEEDAYNLFLTESGLSPTLTNKKIFSNLNIKKQYLLKTYKIYLDSLESEKEKEIVKEEELIFTSTYPSISSFAIEVLKVFREKEIEINNKDFMTVFSIMQEYEDKYIKVTFNSEENLGEIIYKKN